MNTPACLHLPPPPDIVRAQCPPGEPENYLSSYLWKCGCVLPRALFPIFHDLRYGYCLFPHKTLDHNELYYDGAGIYINIDGTAVDKSWIAGAVTYDYNLLKYIARAGYSCPPSASMTNAWSDYASDPSWNIMTQTGWSSIQLKGFYRHEPECDGALGYDASGMKTYVAFDTSAASSSPTDVTLLIDCNVYIHGSSADPTMRIYYQDFGTLDSGDWTGGTLSGSLAVSAGTGQSLEIALDISHVNIGGTSRYRVSLDKIEDGLTPAVGNGWYIKVTNARLRLDY